MSNTNEPNTNEPNTNEPNTNEPNTNEPNTNEPNTNEPNTNEPNTNEPNTTNNNPAAPNQFPKPEPPHLTPTYRIFLEKLLTARKATGVSTAELAKRLQVPESRVRSAESGARPMSFLEVRAWCRALDIDLVDFTETLDALIAAIVETPPTPDE